MKQTLKTIITSLFTAVATLFMVVYISCTKDKCDSMACANGGACDNGKCNCATGYEGDKCKTEARSKFMRNWGVENQTASVTQPARFAVSVGSGSGVSQVVIKNLNNYFTNVTANISRDSIVIPEQTVMGRVVAGAGYIYSTNAYGQNNTISISYTVTDLATRKKYSETEIWNG